MPTFNQGIRTNAGYDLFGKVQSGQTKIHYTKVIFSSLDLSNKTDDDIQDMTDVNPKEVIINNPQVLYKPKTNDSDQETEIRALGSNEALNKGFYINTYALFAADDSGNEILYGVTADNNPSWLPAYDGVRPQALTYNWDTGDKDTDNVHFTDSHDAYATYDDLQEYSSAINNSTSNVASNVYSSMEQISSSFSSMPTRQDEQKTRDLSNQSFNNAKDAIKDTKSDLIQLINDYKEPNLTTCPLNRVYQSNGWVNTENSFMFHAKQDHTYQISMEIKGNSGGWIKGFNGSKGIYSSQSISGLVINVPVNLPNFTVVKGSWTFSKDEDVYIYYQTMGPAPADFKNLCVTDSSNYIPVSVADSNRNALLSSDIYKPNLVDMAPDKIYRNNGWINDEPCFGFHAVAGNNYWISMQIKGNHGGGVNIFDSNKGIYTAKKLYIAAPVPDNINDFVTIKGTWEPSTTQDVFLYYQSRDSEYTYFKNPCVTNTDNYIPVNIAESNKQNMLASISPIKNNN